MSQLRIWDDHSNVWELARAATEALDALDTTEGENTQLRDALSEIAGVNRDLSHPAFAEIRKIARAALVSRSERGEK